VEVSAFDEFAALRPYRQIPHPHLLLQPLEKFANDLFHSLEVSQVGWRISQETKKSQLSMLYI